MRSALRLALVFASGLLVSGCYIYGAAISVVPDERAAAFTQEEQETARALAVRVGRSAGFWETDDAAKLSASDTTWPYRYFVSLGAPGGNAQQRSVSILGAIRKDRREIQISVGDDARGEPLPETRKMIDELRAALESAFPDCRVEVTTRKKLHLLAP
jgi:hypothetical protein